MSKIKLPPFSLPYSDPSLGHFKGYVLTEQQAEIVLEALQLINELAYEHFDAVDKSLIDRKRI